MKGLGARQDPGACRAAAGGSPHRDYRYVLKEYTPHLLNPVQSNATVLRKILPL